MRPLLSDAVASPPWRCSCLCRIRTRMIAKMMAWCLFALALSPLTAPFSTCDLSILLHHPIHRARSLGHQLRRAGSSMPGDSDLSVPRLRSGGRDRTRRDASSGLTVVSAATASTTVRSPLQLRAPSGLTLSNFAIILRL